MPKIKIDNQNRIVRTYYNYDDFTPEQKEQIGTVYEVTEQESPMQSGKITESFYDPETGEITHKFLDKTYLSDSERIKQLEETVAMLMLGGTL